MRLKVVEFGEVAGILTKAEVEALWRYAKRFDVDKGDPKYTYPFCLDARIAAINYWQDEEKGNNIHSTLMISWKEDGNAEVILDTGTFKDPKIPWKKAKYSEEGNWSPETATKKWNEVIERAIEEEQDQEYFYCIFCQRELNAELFNDILLHFQVCRGVKIESIKISSEGYTLYFKDGLRLSPSDYILKK